MSSSESDYEANSNTSAISTNPEALFTTNLTIKITRTQVSTTIRASWRRMSSQKTSTLSFFSDFSSHGAQILKENEDIILAYIDEMLKTRTESEVITIADFGTADGGNVIPIMNKIINHIWRTMSTEQQVNVIFEDQPTNDFNSLARSITGYRKEGLSITGNVHALISPFSMYTQCLPQDSLDFGVSTYAIHWLSKWPTKIKNGIYEMDADQGELTLILDQAAWDWRTFVKNRGIELKPGGLMFVSTLIEGDQQLRKITTDVLREMTKDGIISQTEFENTNAEGMLGRTEEDLKAPFINADDDAELSELGLELVHFELKCREYLPFDQSHAPSDDFEKSRAACISRIVKGYLYNTLYGGLSKERKERERTTIIDLYFEGLRKKILSENRKFKLMNSMADFIFRKKTL